MLTSLNAPHGARKRCRTAREKDVAQRNLAPSVYPKNTTEQAEQWKLPALLAFMVFFVGGVAVLLLLSLKWHPRSRGAVAFPAGEEFSAGSHPKAFIDLRAFYNAGRTTNWMGAGKIIGQDLAALPGGVTAFGGVPFQVEGVVQLRGAGQRKNTSSYPEKVRGIPVRAKASKLHFLHATCWWVSDGTPIAAYRIRFADGSRLEIPVLYGANVRDWFFDANDPNQGQHAAWSSKEGRFFHRVYQTVWENPKPQVEIREVDFVSLGTACYPFLLAITVEQ